MGFSPPELWPGHFTLFSILPLCPGTLMVCRSSWSSDPPLPLPHPEPLTHLSSSGSVIVGPNLPTPADPTGTLLTKRLCCSCVTALLIYIQRSHTANTAILGHFLLCSGAAKERWSFLHGHTVVWVRTCVCVCMHMLLCLRVWERSVVMGLNFILYIATYSLKEPALT